MPSVQHSTTEPPLSIPLRQGPPAVEKRATQPAAVVARQAPAAARWLSAAQGLYYLATGVWPLLNMNSFLAVTGPKTDLWLVNAFGLLVCAVAVPFIVAAASGWVTLLVGVLGIATSATLIGIDVVYVARGTIAATYLLDAMAEAVILIGWLWLLRSLPRR